jgi:hypothetical protein
VRQLQAIVLAELTAFNCEIETTIGYKVTSFDSQYVTFLRAFELDSEGMTSLHTTGSSTPYVLPVGWSHFSTILALILLEIEYSYGGGGGREGRGTFHDNTRHLSEADDEVARFRFFGNVCKLNFESNHFRSELGQANNCDWQMERRNVRGNINAAFHDKSDKSSDT